MAQLQQSSKPAVVPKCFGYLDLTRPPQVVAEGRRPRHPFRSTRYRPAVFLDFLTLTPEEEEQGSQLGESNEVIRQWQHYFKTASKVILRGLVFQEIDTRILEEADLVKGKETSLFSSGWDGLARIHKAGVLHGDVKNIENALVTPIDERIVWVDFSMARTCSQMQRHKFERLAAAELVRWAAHFCLAPGPSICSIEGTEDT